jgi:UDP-N-acetylglucosamine 1-carboxyvinyltransferase
LEVCHVDLIRLSGGRRLNGTVNAGCAKNAVLPILAACLMSGAPVTLSQFPMLTDTRNMLSILETLGCRTSLTGSTAVINGASADRYEMPEALSKLLRSSIFMMGPILARFRRATVTYPGGCEIGQRPIELHLRGLAALGVQIREAHGMIYLDGENMRGGEVYLDFPSVGATENVMMAGVLTRGVTRIHNAAREPEIVDLERFINALGGRISGAGSGTITVTGVDGLGGGQYRPITDRIVAGTLLVAAAVTGGDVRVADAVPGDMGAVLGKLRQAGCELDLSGEGVRLDAPERLRPVDVSTQPFPGFPTDMQAQIMAQAAVADGASVIVENVFENRFAHAPELRRMGAEIIVNNRTAVVRGARLTGARVTARDLRGGAALIIAGLAAEGVTEIEHVELIDRGYEFIERKLSLLGADIRRIPTK